MILPSTIGLGKLDFQALRHGRLQGPFPTERSLTSDSNPETPKLIVQEQVKDLKEALASSELKQEQVNIKATIDAYESGRVGYTKNYTLIWAGQVVDTAAPYGDFWVDRKERRDRYAEVRRQLAMVGESSRHSSKRSIPSQRMPSYPSTA